jgi:hypothetical protein
MIARSFVALIDHEFIGAATSGGKPGVPEALIAVAIAFSSPALPAWPEL